MAYCTLAQVRAEGVTSTVADDARVTALIAAASALIDRVTGWWFEERTLTLVLSGRGTRYLHLPAPATAVTEVRRVWRTTVPVTTLEIESTWYRLVSYDLPRDAWNPHLVLLAGAAYQLVVDPWEVADCWVRGDGNYEVDGTFGFVEDDGAGGYTHPAAVQRACLLLVAQWARTITDAGAAEARARASGDLRSLTVQGRSATWGGPSSAGTTTGVQEADLLLAYYRRPPAMRAA